MLVVMRFKKYWSRDLSRGQLVAMATAIFNHLSEFLNCFWIYLDYSLGAIKNALQSSLVIHLVVGLELTHLKKACSMLVTKTLLTSLNVNKKNIRKMSSDFVLLFYIANFEQGNIFVVNFEDDFLSWKALLYIFFHRLHWNRIRLYIFHRAQCNFSMKSLKNVAKLSSINDENEEKIRL